MRRTKTLRNALLLFVFSMLIGYFLGEFFVWLSGTAGWLGFLNYVGFSHPIGLDTVNLNLMFMQLDFGINFQISLLGVIITIVSLIIYWRKK